ncbi:DUF4435 domain-containing protein [Luteimonas sp. A649]
MEDFADYLVSQSQTESAALHEFMLRFVESSDDLHLFFEGEEDPSFYMPAVRARASKLISWKYVCNGKPALAELRNYLVKKGYPLSRVLFFVDRDFDDLLGCQISSEPRTFITDYYSIENYLVGRSQAEVVLVDLSGLSQGDFDCSKFLSSIEDLLAQCAKAALPYIAMTLAARERGLKTNLQNLTLSNVFVVSLESSQIKRRQGAASRCRASVLPKDAVVPFQDQLRWARRLRAINSKLWFRGKYELWFFEKLLMLFLEQLAVKRRSAKRKAVRVPASLREGRLFEALGGRLGPITSLDAFLEGAIP